MRTVGITDLRDVEWAILEGEGRISGDPTPLRPEGRAPNAFFSSRISLAGFARVRLRPILPIAN